MTLPAVMTIGAHRSITMEKAWTKQAFDPA